MKRRNILRLFESRRGHLEYRAKRDYVRNGIASIPCRIFSFTDVISPYSVKVFFILLWFMGESLCDYIFLTGHDLRRERRLAGRLASIKVVFSETYKDPDYTDSEVEKLYSEIEQDVTETIQEDNLYQKEETL